MTQVTYTSEGETSTAIPRLVIYWQTHFQNGEFVSALPLLTENTGTTHVVVAAIHLERTVGVINLNDDPYDAETHEVVWADAHALQRGGIKVLGMLGGAARGSFTWLDGPQARFEEYYAPLRRMLQWTALDGLDLDIEEAMSLAGVIRFVDRLKRDFGDDFLITLAPIATALKGEENLSGFDHEALEKAFSDKIAWYNTQFYCGWGSMESELDYENIMTRGWPIEKIVIGLVTNPANCAGYVDDTTLRRTMQIILEKFPSFGGIMGWEYFNSITDEVPEAAGKPWSWAQMISDTLHSKKNKYSSS
jgi:chitinase